MKKVLKFIIPIFLLVIVLSSYSIKNEVKDPKKDKVLIAVLNHILTKGHYLPKQINDDFSEQVFTSFIDGLDPTKRYFTQEDIKEFSKYKYQIDNQIKSADLTFYNLVYGRFTQKIKKAKIYYSQILEQPFNFLKKEIIDLDYKKVPFATNENELIDYWRKQLKLNTIGRIKEKQELEKEKAKEDKKFKKTSFKILEKQARQEVLKNMDELYIRIEELENSDWFSTFLNSITSSFDPHSMYMDPRIKERFDQDISGKLEGIGARLQKKGIYTHVVELVSGGPAWKQGELEAADIILKVAQADGKPIEIVGMRLDDAIKFIKGKKGTEVRLTVKKKIDGSIKVISIIRDVVHLDETFVKSSIVEKEGKKYGLINLPKFYINFDDKNFRNSAKDMEKEIKSLKEEESVRGLLIDLRNNGGGSLKTAIKIAGLFIDEGPIVQVKYREGKPMIQSDTDSKIQWGGPLVILVNEFSASASEIFAAAMQDYKRAVIVGGNQTYGKGTVQNILSIDKFFKNTKDLGFIKMTIQKFYRINGGSTQKEGVYPNVTMPSKYSYMKFGERDKEGSLEWDKVAKADYKEVDSYQNFDEVVNKSKERIEYDKKFQLINEYAKWLKKNQNNSTYSLNYKTFAKETDKKKKEAEKFISAFKFDSKLYFFSPKYELPLLEKDSVLNGKRIAWHKNLSKDIYVSEALNILSELKMKSQYKIVEE